MANKTVKKRPIGTRRTIAGIFGTIASFLTAKLLGKYVFNVDFKITGLVLLLVIMGSFYGSFISKTIHQIFGTYDPRCD